MSLSRSSARRKFVRLSPILCLRSWFRDACWQSLLDLMCMARSSSFPCLVFSFFFYSPPSSSPYTRPGISARKAVPWESRGRGCVRGTRRGWAGRRGVLDWMDGLGQAGIIDCPWYLCSLRSWSPGERNTCMMFMDRVCLAVCICRCVHLTLASDRYPRTRTGHGLANPFMLPEAIPPGRQGGFGLREPLRIRIRNPRT